MIAAQTATCIMRFLGKIFAHFRARRAAPQGGYDPEVLFAGWVQLPASFREFLRRKPGTLPRTLRN